MTTKGDRWSYRVYVLRTWCEVRPSAGLPFDRRYSLEDTATRERRGFADLTALVRFLTSEAETRSRQCDDQVVDKAQLERGS